jgi:hypothetical protein
MKNSIRILAMFGLVAGMAMVGSAHAADTDTSMDNQGDASVQSSQDSVDDQIEALRATLGAMTAQQNDFAKMFKNMVNLSGDIRFRYEANNWYTTPAVKVGATTYEAGMARTIGYERYRIRARLQDLAKVNDFTTAVVRLTTDAYLSGNAPYGQPNTANQTLNSYGDKDPVALDKAYIDVAPQVPSLPVFIAGVQGMPFLLDGTNANLIFDDNLTDGGMSLGLTSPTMWGLDLRAVGAQFINEDSKTGFDGYTPVQHPMFEGEQAILDWNAAPMGQTMGLSLAAANYTWHYISGTNVFPQGSAGTYTNSVNNTTADLLDYGYSLRDLLGVYNTNIMGVPTKAYYEYVINKDVNHNNTGYVAGAEIASGDMIPWSKNEITLGYNYRRVETDAVLGIWSDGDFDGGGTDAMGGKFYAKVMVGDNLWVSLQQYNDQGNLEAEATGGHYSLFQRTQVDLNAKF